MSIWGGKILGKSLEILIFSADNPTIFLVRILPEYLT
jgi:hypothetical protein